jgi:hypothetical protein
LQKAIANDCRLQKVIAKTILNDCKLQQVIVNDCRLQRGLQMIADCKK